MREQARVLAQVGITTLRLMALGIIPHTTVPLLRTLLPQHALLLRQSLPEHLGGAEAV